MSTKKSITSTGSASTETQSSTSQEKRSSTTQSTHRTQMSKTTGSESIERSQTSGGNASVTRTTTIYDADGNIVKVITNVDDQPVPQSHDRSIEYRTTSTNSNNINERSAFDNQNGRRIETMQEEDEYDIRSRSPTGSVATTYLVDENYVDTSKMRNKNASSDFKNFYGHGIDSNRTVVGNSYDSNAIQNTIGTRGKVIMDHNIDTTDVVFSNDRNYGKTGWNGKFVNEEPQQARKVVETQKMKPWDKPVSLISKAKLRPEDLPPAGVPTANRQKC